jgi:hypothetical protein
MNRYAVDLEIPFKFPLRDKEQFDAIPKPTVGIKNTWHRSDLLPEELNSDFVSWLDSLGLVVPSWDIFIQPPQWEMHIHIDQHDSFLDAAKLNFAWYETDGYSNMCWYHAEEKDSTIRGNAGGLYRNWEKQVSQLIYEHRVGLPTLINAGLPHNVINKTDGYRICVSVPLVRKDLIHLMSDDNVLYLTWDDALEIFKDYIV